LPTHSHIEESIQFIECTRWFKNIMTVKENLHKNPFPNYSRSTLNTLMQIVCTIYTCYNVVPAFLSFDNFPEKLQFVQLNTSCIMHAIWKFYVFFLSLFFYKFKLFYFPRWFTFFYGLILSFTIAAKLSCCGHTFITDMSPMSCHIAFRMTQLGGVKQKSVIYDISGIAKDHNQCSFRNPFLCFIYGTRQKRLGSHPNGKLKHAINKLLEEGWFCRLSFLRAYLLFFHCYPRE
jgi:hypothetical protein